MIYNNNFKIIFLIIFSFSFSHIRTQTESECGNGDEIITISYYDTTPYRNPDFNFLPSYVPPTVYYDDRAPENQFVSKTLGPNRKPIYILGDQPFMVGDVTLVHNEESFNGWFNSDPCISYPTTIRYNYTNFGDSILLSIQCLPLDGGGFANFTVYPDDQWEIDHPQSHNYYFCAEMHFTASLFPSELDSRLFLSTTNDAIVYLDNELVMSAVLRYENRINLQYPPSDIKRDIQVDAFLCNKGQTRFNFFIQIEQGFIECKYYDACNVCQGDNSTCPCTSSTICELYDDACKVCTPVDCPVENRCQQSGCSIEQGCYTTNITCREPEDKCQRSFCNIEGTINDPICITEEIPDCIPCSNGQVCITTDKCHPVICENDECVQTFIDCNTTDSCLEGYCLYGECHFIDICSTDTLSTTVSSTVISSTLMSSTSPTTVGPVTVTETASTVLSTILSSTTSIATSSTTGTGASTSTETITTTIDSSVTTKNLVVCTSDSCPHHYCCLQLYDSYTCYSKHFEENCYPDRLKEYY